MQGLTSFVAGACPQALAVLEVSTCFSSTDFASSEFACLQVSTVLVVSGALLIVSVCLQATIVLIAK